MIAQAGFPAGLDHAQGERPRFRYFAGAAGDIPPSVVPDQLISQPTPLAIGGTELVLYPTAGGETSDALLVHLPASGVLFTGDVMMPYLGQPFAAEGSPEGLLRSLIPRPGIRHDVRSPPSSATWPRHRHDEEASAGVLRMPWKRAREPELAGWYQADDSERTPGERRPAGSRDHASSTVAGLRQPRARPWAGQQIRHAEGHRARFSGAAISCARWVCAQPCADQPRTSRRSACRSAAQQVAG